MPEPLVVIPGLNCTAELWGLQIAALGQLAEIQVADHTRHADIRSLAASILATAPPRFALAGLSMGGYIAFEMMRQAPDRITRLALLDTSARPDTPEQTERRREQIRMAEQGRFSEIPDIQFPLLVHRNRHGDAALKAVVRRMAEETGPAAFVRQLEAIMSRPDSRPLLGRIACPTLVLVGEGDELTPPELAREIAAGIPGAALAIVPDAGHLPTLETPEAVSERLRDWLTRP